MSTNKSVLVTGNKNLCYNYINALKAVNVTPVFEMFDKTFDGLLLTGGGDILPSLYGEPNYCSNDIDKTRDYTELLLLEKYLNHGLPVLGICRGLQIINVFCGGSLLQHINGHSQISNNDSFHTVLNFKRNFTYELFGKTLNVASAHHQAIKKLGSDLKIAAVSFDGVIEAIETTNVYATQFHPERMGNTGLKVFEFFANKL